MRPEKILEDQIIMVIKTVEDPEIPVNIGQAVVGTVIALFVVGTVIEAGGLKDRFSV